MKRLSLKEVLQLLKEDSGYFVQVNEITRQIRLVRNNSLYFVENIGYLTFNQFIKLDLSFGLVEYPIKNYMYDYYTIRKEY